MIVRNEELTNLDRIFTFIVNEFLNNIRHSIPELTRKSIFQGLYDSACAAHIKGQITCEEKDIFLNRKELAKTNRNIEVMTEITEKYVFKFCFD